MNILDDIVNARNGAAVRQLGAQFGLGQEQTAAALSALVPALAAGFQRNLQSEGGLESLVSALSTGRHQDYIDNPATLGEATAVADGDGILGHVLGSKDVSRQVASRAAAQTGLSAELMKQLLPLAATLMMGAFARRSAGSAPTSAGPAASGGGIADMLGPLLDRNRDGSILDDVAGMAGRFLNRS
jgi:hypothetical protein